MNEQTKDINEHRNIHHRNNNNNERKKGQYHESINFATQQMSENAQFSITIAVGIFGILAIFASINEHDEDLKNALWMKHLNIILIGIVLSIDYWALVLFGIQSYVSRRLSEGMTGNYLKKSNQEWYFNDIKEIVRENKFVNFIFKLWSSNHERKDRYKEMYKSYLYM